VGKRRGGGGARAGAAVVVGLAAYAGCAILPYVGVAFDVSQTMYSNLRPEPGSNNHLFLPQAQWTDLGIYLTDVEALVSPVPARGPSQARAAFLVAGRRHALNLESVRVAIAGLCADGHGVSLRYRLPEGAERRVTNACAEPDLSPHAALPLRLYPPSRERP